MFIIRKVIIKQPDPGFFTMQERMASMRKILGSRPVNCASIHGWRHDAVPVREPMGVIGMIRLRDRLREALNEPALSVEYSAYVADDQVGHEIERITV